MSVDAYAYVGFGWIIDRKQMRQMEEAAGDLWGDFEDCFSWINSYDENSKIFLGESISGTKTYIPILESLNGFNLEKFVEKYEELFATCGADTSLLAQEPKLYLIQEWS